MNVQKTEKLQGTVKAPSSKSYSHRAIIVGSLAGRTTVLNSLDCDDTRNTIKLCRKLGADIKEQDGKLTIKGCNGRPKLGGKTLNVGEAGTLLRLALPLTALSKGKVVVNGKGSLLERPNRQVVDVLRAWGVDIEGRGPTHALPIHVNANGILTGGSATVEGSVTSQVVTALLLAAPFARDDTVLRLPRRLVSRPYVAVTIDVLRWAGIRVERDGFKVFRVKHGRSFRPQRPFTVHGDYSSASFLLAAAVLTKSDVTVLDLANDSQGDKRIINILRAMGARIDRSGRKVRVRGPFQLRGVSVDGSDVPDLVPILSTLACFARGTTRIYNVAHLAHKESNRLAMPAGELKKLGARISHSSDALIIKGSRLHGNRVSSCGDHRIAMSMAVAGLRLKEGVTIDGAESISKSYPNFIRDMRHLGAAITRK